MPKPPPLWMTDEEQIAQWNRAFPSKKIHKQSPTNALTKAIRDYTTLLGCATARVNTTGNFNHDKQIFVTSGATNGYEDIDIILPIVINGLRLGLKVAVEVKVGKDRHRPEQKVRMEAVRKAGGIYIIAKTFDQFKVDFDKLITLYKEYK